MKYLLTSGGIQNESIRGKLLELLGKPIEECKALCIPTAGYAFRQGYKHATKFISGTEETPMCELGWKSLGVLELSAISVVDQSVWLPEVMETDVFLVNGGDPLFLYYWMKQSGFGALIPSLNSVYIGLSAGSMIMAPRIGQDFVRWNPFHMSDETFGYVDFAIYPHVGHPMLPENTMEDALNWSQGLNIPAYAIDDQTAIAVVDHQIQVISEGVWKKL